MSTDQQTEEKKPTRGSAASVPAAVDLPSSEDSDSMPLDFSVVSEMQPVPPEIGYLACITKFDPTNSIAGNKMVNVELTVQEPKEFAGRKMNRRYSLLPQALFSMYYLLNSIGVSQEELDSGTYRLKPAEYIGLTCVVYTAVTEYQGVTRSEPRRTVHASKWAQITEEESVTLVKVLEEIEAEVTAEF